MIAGVSHSFNVLTVARNDGRGSFLRVAGERRGAVGAARVNNVHRHRNPRHHFQRQRRPRWSGGRAASPVLIRCRLRFYGDDGRALIRARKWIDGGVIDTVMGSRPTASSPSDGVVAAAAAATGEGAASVGEEEEEEMNADAKKPEPRKAVVVGAGPAGALSALYLANQGWHVRVYEARPRAPPPQPPAATVASSPSPSSSSPRRSPDRSYNIVLSPRGLGALEGAGVTLPDDGVVRLQGNVRHLDGVGKLSRQFKGTVAVNRGVLADAIVATAVAKHGDDPPPVAAAAAADGGGVTFVYNRPVHEVDFASRVARFAKSPRRPGETDFDDVDSRSYANVGFYDDVAIESASYDLLVAADGVNSAVRGMLVDDGLVTVDQNTDQMLFKTVRLPVQTPPPPGDTKKNEAVTSNTEEAESDSDTWRRCFHTWPKGLISMLAPPDPEGTLSAVVILPGGKHAPDTKKGEKKSERNTTWTWDRVNTKEDVAALFRECFPDAFGRRHSRGGGGTSSHPSEIEFEFEPPSDEECERVLAQKPRPGGITTTCSRLTAHGGTVALVGDAAHSMWPSLGQGCNAALETVQYLSAALESSPSDQASAMDYFERVRRPQVHAAGRLSEAGFGGTAKRAGNFLFFAKLATLMALHKLMPFFFDRPALTRINDPEWGYDDIEDEVQGETATLASLAGVAAAAAICTTVFGWEAFIRGALNVVKAVVMGEEGNEGTAIVVLGIAAAATAVFRALGKRRKSRRRKGNLTVGRAATA